jgi:ABC-type uncharacterized transport system substrate-binding protein
MRQFGALQGVAPSLSSSGIGAMLQATRSIPIVFAVVADPVGAGLTACRAPAVTLPALAISNMA